MKYKVYSDVWDVDIRDAVEIECSSIEEAVQEWCIQENDNGNFTMYHREYPQGHKMFIVDENNETHVRYVDTDLEPVFYVYNGNFR